MTLSNDAFSNDAIARPPADPTNPNLTPNLTPVPATLEQTAADLKLSDDQYRQKMARRKQVQEQRLAERTQEKGLIIVHTGNGKGKTTAALGMVLRSLGHGYSVAIVQFIKGAWEPAEKAAFAPWGEQIQFHAMGEGFTWETQDRDRDMQMAQQAWEKALSFIRNPHYHLVLLDEVNIALKLGYLSVETVLAGLQEKPEGSHVILTGRGAPAALIAAADLVTEMSLVKHPFREQGIKAQAGIEY
ncbi:MAG: cob(I)yrinic acid a,c-diamide adenosyltransferase [Synechococcales bacterium]|nr:cob(I)yrinic acid a,c-diamide adenosyltransferase [Synechococcales bacterium]